MDQVVYFPIGIIHSPFSEIKGMPLQPMGAQGIPGRVEVNQDLLPGMEDLEGFSHIILIYHFHASQGFSLRVKPFLDDRYHGVFATRVPKRPNSVGISIVRLVKIEGHILHIEDVDILDGTPLLDIKPYVPEFDTRQTERVGWFAGKAGQVKTLKADGRFTE